jgi:AraC-like DNA-binding protein
MLVRASLTAPTLDVALRRWCRHHALLTGDIVFRLERQAGVARCVVEEHADLGAMREFCLLTSLRNAHGVACWLVDSRIPLHEVRFPFAAPNRTGPAGFSFDARYLDLPLRRDERALQAMLQQALQLIVLPYRRDRLLVQRVRELLRARGSELRGGAALAGALHLSLRTLHRQLKDEGASLQALKDEARREQAVDLLRRTSHPLKRVAEAVGFGNEKSFARAFRQWTGAPPGAFRRTR